MSVPDILGTQGGLGVGIEGGGAIGLEAPTAFLVPSKRMVVMAPNTSQVITIYGSSGGPYGGDAGPLVATPNLYGPVAAIPVNGSTSQFTISNTAAYGASILLTFTATNPATGAALTCYVTVLVYQANVLVQNGRSAAQAVATVRRRTNLNFGEPSDADIVAMLNDGIEEVARRIEPVVAQASVLISAPNTNIMALPQDVERVRDANFSTGDPSIPGTVVYELVQMDYDEFIQETDASPAGGVGGIPTIYTMIQDQSGIMLVQFYPYSNFGQFNFHYYKRPTMYGTATIGGVLVADPNSYTDLDSLWQGSVLLFACMEACENREDYKIAGEYFGKAFEESVERNMLETKRRVRKRGIVTVRDVSVNESVIPIWTR